MKQFLKKILPKTLIERLQVFLAMRAWKKKNFLENSPQFVKQKVFEKYGIKNAIWVETGTYKGTTTEFLRNRYPHVHTIEPGLDLFNSAARRFSGKNVTLYNDVSENVFPALLPSLKGDINFWLDGHYSSGVTFKGEKDCPVEDELKAIEVNFDNFKNLTILIDDVRCFLPSSSKYSDYPSIDYLVDWARKFNMRWRIEHDIFVMQTVYRHSE